DGKVYFVSTRGEVVVLEAGREGKELARNRLPAQALIATPAIADGRLWVRTRDKLWVIGEK
ncbi:MAG TPA: serine/threonine protein kinase, partial [Planctomycetota bacterium]|nr:serine/threonine protein kinase [Planctomycetota bacterium]